MESLVNSTDVQIIQDVDLLCLIRNNHITHIRPQLVNKNLKKNQLRLSFSGSLLFFEKNGASVQNKKAKPVSKFKKRFQEKRPESNTYSRLRQT